MNDILKDPDTIEKIKELISANLREDGWAEMAHIGALLSANNINLKANGYKVKAYFEDLNQEFEVSIDNKTNLPLVKVRQHLEKKVDQMKNNNNKEKKDILHLTKWANINQKASIEALSCLAIPERWSYKTENKNYPKPILAKYLKWTFVKLHREDKILFSNDYAAFNTGLVDKFYRPIYAVFDKNKIPNKQPWYFVGFCVAGSSDIASRILTNNFSVLPQRASYINSYDDVMYDYTLPVDVNWNHIVLENIARLPYALIEQICSGAFGIKDTENLSNEEKEAYLSDLKMFLEKDPMRLSVISGIMNMAVERAKLRVEWNYKTAIPVYYPTDDKVHLILPLSLNMNEPEEISLALVMTKTPAHRYRAVTIFTLDMAYSNARLITKPSSDWLIAETINMK